MTGPVDLVARGRRTLGGAVLAGEALVLLFAALVAKDTSRFSPGVALAVGGGLAVLAILLAGLLGRRAGLVGGSLLQAAVVVSGVVVPLMFLLGAVFTALWVLALVLPAKAAQQRAAGPNAPD